MMFKMPKLLFSHKHVVLNNIVIKIHVVFSSKFLINVVVMGIIEIYVVYSN